MHGIVICHGCNNVASYFGSYSINIQFVRVTFNFEFDVHMPHQCVTRDLQFGLLFTHTVSYVYVKLQQISFHLTQISYLTHYVLAQDPLIIHFVSHLSDSNFFSNSHCSPHHHHHIPAHSTAVHTTTLCRLWCRNCQIGCK